MVIKFESTHCKLILKKKLVYFLHTAMPDNTPPLPNKALDLAQQYHDIPARQSLVHEVILALRN